MAEELDLPWCFDDEHIAWQKTMQEFCQRVVAPGAVQRDLEGRFDPDLIREVGKLGAFGLRIPAAHGRDGAAGARAPISAFLVPLDAPGVTVGPKYPKMGWRSSDTHPLYFDGVRVPGHHLLGQEGRGYREALGFLTWARIPIAAMAA